MVDGKDGVWRAGCKLGLGGDEFVHMVGAFEALSVDCNY